MSKIQRAILSVTDKTGLVEFARRLAAMGVELVSTGGTAKLLRDSGIAVKDISELTGFPEMLDGRVKTLHPKVHGGILHIREQCGASRGGRRARHRAHRHGGGESLRLREDGGQAGRGIRRHHREHRHRRAVDGALGGQEFSGCRHRHLARRLRGHRQRDGEPPAASLSLKTKWRLAQKAFATTAAYDSAIASTLEQIGAPEADGGKFSSSTAAEGFPKTLRLSFRKAFDLRYGENPHQKAALYSDGSGKGVANGKQLQGKELSYNNIVDLQAAWDLAQEFDEPVCAIIKHTNPCGTAVAATLAEAYKRALECDPVSAFGGVIGVNRPVDRDTATEMAKLFVEAIAAPGFDRCGARNLRRKKNLRLVEVVPMEQKWVLKNVSGGVLLQDNDVRPLTDADLKVVSERQPSEQEMRDLLFAWKVCKHVKSNAILYARNGQTTGVGAGQMSRVDSAQIGAMKSVLGIKGSVAASDAFFPFPDGVEEIAKAGATAIIQPGGSVRDQEVIDAANRLGLAMVMTGVRHFRH